MTSSDEEQAENLQELLEAGTEIVGGLTGASVGLAMGGPPGAVAGAAIGPLVSHVLLWAASEIKARILGPREEARIGATIIYAEKKIEEKVAGGQEIRKDDFFEPQENDRSAAHEVLESVLLVAQREPQEKKLPFYGNLLANIAFHSEINRAQANLLIRLANDLSYRQYCLLALFANKDEYSLRAEDYKSAEEEGVSLPIVGTLQEVLDLYSRGMLNASGSAVLGLLNICPARMNLQGTGAALFNFMELWGVQKEDIFEVALLLE